MRTFGSYIDGTWTKADLRENRNPSDLSDVIGLYSSAGPDAVAAAVAAARAAQPAWARASPQVRADLLESVAARILADAAGLAELLAREEGKTLPEATAEVIRAGQIFRFFSGEALRMTGEHQASTRPDVSVTIHREPVGVVGIITPWNFPMAIPAWKSAPALAFGNAVVLKPADLVPASAVALTAIIEDAGFPAGVFNLVTGPGSVAGNALVENPDVDAITFTGSEAVGTRVAAAGAARLADVQLEMGGKNPLVVSADADLEVAVECAVNGAFFATGQRCTASSRLIVEDAVHDDFRERMLKRMSELRVGQALEPDTDIGPVVDERQLAIDERYLEIARSEGGDVHGGARPDAGTVGYFLEPAIVEGLGNDATINREEVFGPVATLIPVSDHDEAVAVANDTDYGLVAGICTRSLARAEDFQRRADAGMVMVNLPTGGVDPHVPFGGRKRSSYGPKEQGAHAREFFTQLKTAYVKP